MRRQTLLRNGFKSVTVLLLCFVLVFMSLPGTVLGESGKMSTVTVVDTSLTKDASIQGSFSIKFNENIYEGTNFSNIIITKDGVMLEDIIIAIYGDRICFTNKDNYWKYGTTYIIKIPAGAVRDEIGNVLESEYTKSITTIKDPKAKDTAPPYVIETSSTNNLSIHERFIITFSKSVIEGKEFQNIKITKDGAIIQNVKAVLYGNELIFVCLDGYWSKNSTYTINLPKEIVKDDSDNFFSRDYTVSFSTEKYESVPYVSMTTLTSDALINQSIILYFTENITESINFSDIKITKNGVVQENVAIEINGCSLNFINKDLYWSNDTDYTVTVPQGAVKDSEGNPNNYYTDTFTTIAVIPKDRAEPTKIGTSPRENVAIQGKIELYFSEDIYEGEHFSDIRVENAKEGAKSVDVKISNNKIIISNKEVSWEYGTEYAIIIPAGAIKDEAGNLSTDNYINWFTTEKDENIKNNTPLKVIGTSTIKDVPIRGDFNINFSENIYEGNNFSGIKISNAEVLIKDVDIKISSNKIIISNKGIPWEYNKTYKITLPAGSVKDESGNLLENDYSVSFTTIKSINVIDTIAPTVIITMSTSNVGVRESFEMIFDENIYAGTNFGDINVISAGKALKNIDVKISGSKLTVSNKATSWEYNSTYTISIPKGAIKDEAGNLFINDYSISFTTEKQTTSVPVVTSNPVQSNVVVSQPVITIPASSLTFSVKGVVYKKYSGRNSRVPNPIVDITYSKDNVQNTVHAETDSYGNFKVDVPADGKDYNLVVSKEDYESTSTPINLNRDNSNVIIEIAYTKGLFEIEGTVTNKHTLESIGNAEIYLNIEDPNVGMNWKEVTDENGHFKFKGVVGGTTHSLRIRKSGYVDENCNEPKLGVEIKNSNVNLGYIYIINTNGYVNISGKVTDQDNGRALKGVKVNVKGSTGFVSTTDANGIYYIPGVASNAEHILEFSIEGYLPESLKVKVLDKNLTFNNKVCHLRKLSGYVYEGYFVGENSKTPISKVTVWVNDRNWQKNTISDGSFEFKDTAPARHAIFAKKSGYKTYDFKERDLKYVDASGGDRAVNLYLVKDENFPDNWATDIVKTAFQNGFLTNSTRKEFKKFITRQEFAEIVVNLYEKVRGKKIVEDKLSKIANVEFADVTNKNPFYNYIIKSRKIGVFKGDEKNCFNPIGEITRKDMAVIIYRLYQNLYTDFKGSTFSFIKSLYENVSKIKDCINIDLSAQEAVAFLSSNGIMSGDGTGNFYPQKNTTKQETIKIILKAYDKIIEIDEIKRLKKAARQIPPIVSNLKIESDLFKVKLAFNVSPADSDISVYYSKVGENLGFAYPVDDKGNGKRELFIEGGLEENTKYLLKFNYINGDNCQTPFYQKEIKTESWLEHLGSNWVAFCDGIKSGLVNTVKGTCDFVIEFKDDAFGTIGRSIDNTFKGVGVVIDGACYVYNNPEDAQKSIDSFLNSVDATEEINKAIGEAGVAIVVSDGMGNIAKVSLGKVKNISKIKVIAVDTISSIKKALKTAGEKVFEKVRTVARIGNKYKITTVDDIELEIDRSGLLNQLKADGMSSEAAENAIECLENGCFTGDTLIATVSGLKRIDSIKEGDYVLSKDVNTGNIDFKEVKHIYIKSSYEFVHLKVGGEEIRTTANHLFFTDSGWWKAAEDIKVGDKILNSNGEFKSLIGKSVETLEEPESIYNLNVDQFHTYFVGESGLLVHNDCTLSLTKVMNEISDFTYLYRAVGPEEFYSVMNAGKFDVIPSKLQAKQFGLSFNETVKFAERYSDIAAVIEIKIPTNVLNQVGDFSHVDKFLFKSGTVTIHADSLSDFNRAIQVITHVY